MAKDLAGSVKSWQRYKMRLRWAENRGGAGHPGGVEIMVGRAARFHNIAKKPKNYYILLD
jgi:hypothetical protein